MRCAANICACVKDDLKLVIEFTNFERGKLLRSLDLV